MYDCPKCGSGNTQAFKMACIAGRSKSVGVVDGMTTDLEDGFIGFSRSTTTSDLSRLLGPPEKRKVPAILSLCCLLAFPMLFYLRHVERQYKKWNEEEYPRLNAEWENSWICHKCGTAYVVKEEV